MGLGLILVVAACAQGVPNPSGPAASNTAGPAASTNPSPVAYSGTITIVQDSQVDTNWDKQHMTVDVRLIADTSGRYGQFEDNGSTYQYEGSTHQEVHSTGCTMIQDSTMTGGGAFDSPGRGIWLDVDVDPADPASSFLTIDTTYTATTGGWKGCGADDPSSTGPGGWDPGCGEAPNEYQGTAASDGSIDFTCTATGAFGEPGGLIVTGSLTRH